MKLVRINTDFDVGQFRIPALVCCVSRLRYEKLCLPHFWYLHDEPYFKTMCSTVNFSSECVLKTTSSWQTVVAVYLYIVFILQKMSAEGEAGRKRRNERPETENEW